uniref:Uncharacterized protein n=1 Tax=Rhizophagus irregularis (strain DAOM 181602 / DAOM 197198 / MUCL 43194) TaxID=747089 RepID=U9TJA4_RHIID
MRTSEIIWKFCFAFDLITKPFPLIMKEHACTVYFFTRHARYGKSMNLDKTSGSKEHNINTQVKTIKKAK